MLGDDERSRHEPPRAGSAGTEVPAPSGVGEEIGCRALAPCGGRGRWGSRLLASPRCPPPLPAPAASGPGGRRANPSLLRQTPGPGHWQTDRAGTPCSGGPDVDPRPRLGAQGTKPPGPPPCGTLDFQSPWPGVLRPPSSRPATLQRDAAGVPRLPVPFAPPPSEGLERGYNDISSKAFDRGKCISCFLLEPGRAAGSAFCFSYACF